MHDACRVYTMCVITAGALEIVGFGAAGGELGVCTSIYEFGGLMMMSMSMYTSLVDGYDC